MVNHLYDIKQLDFIVFLSKSYPQIILKKIFKQINVCYKIIKTTSATLKLIFNRLPFTRMLKYSRRDSYRT